jgi:hypothetical protein
MATVNKRIYHPQAMAINGIDAGGAMTANINCGFDNILRSAPDGLQVPLRDREVQFVRGTIVSQNWIEAIALLTGTLGTYVFYERKSGVAEAAGYIKHTITAPVIHRIALAITKGGYATVSFDFECRAADPTKTIADMWAMTDSQNAPTYIAAARGGYRVESAVFATTINIYHVTGFNFAIALPLVKECNDADIGYTCVDALLDGLTANGSISFQDATITATALLALTLVTHAKGTLILTLTQGQGAADKVVTVAGVEFDNAGQNSSANAPFTEFTVNFEVANDPTTQLTLTGTNKIITIV